MKITRLAIIILVSLGCGSDDDDASSQPVSCETFCEYGIAELERCERLVESNALQECLELCRDDSAAAAMFGCYEETQTYLRCATTNQLDCNGDVDLGICPELYAMARQCVATALSNER